MSGLAWADSYLGQLRTLAGDRTLLLVGSRSVLRDDAGRVLLIRRSDNGQWAMPAGAMELGESIGGCARREVAEETGLRAIRVTPFACHTDPRFAATNQWGHHYQIFAVLFRVDEWVGELTTSTDETTDARFFPPDELPDPLVGTVRETLADLAEYERAGAFIMK